MRRVIEELIERRKTRQDELKASLSELAEAVEQRGILKKNGRKIRDGFSRFRDALEAYVGAQDKEWDAYASNHATTVFKSLQWKIEKLEAEYSNLRTLLVHFAQLENRLDRLLESLDGIFSAQVIEHFQPGYLRRLISECFRVLRPGGILLLETINPLSVFALSRIYFLDPSHQSPLHPEYMRYLLENSGFAAVEISYGAEPEGEKLEEIGPAEPLARPFNGNVDRLNRLLFSHCEYAVKGMKPRPGGAVRP